MKRACVLLADGCEEVEAITPVDYLRRAGIETVTLGLDGRDVVGAHGIAMAADRTLDELNGEDFDCVVVPGGGKGADAIAGSRMAVEFIRRLSGEGAVVAAICAAPALVLGAACGLLKGKRFTCYPGLESSVPDGRFSEERVVTDGMLVTARSAGCAGEFAVAVISLLEGEAAAEKVARAVFLAQ